MFETDHIDSHVLCKCGCSYFKVFSTDEGFIVKCGACDQVLFRRLI